MKRGNPEPLTAKLKSELDVLARMPDSEIDSIEMPPVSDWSKADARRVYSGPSSGPSPCGWMPTSLTGFSARARAIKHE